MTPEDSKVFSDRLNSLGPAQRALLERRLIERQLRTASAEAITPRETRGPVPVSYSQELLWLVDQMSPGGASYNSPSAFRLEGTLDEGVLSAAINELVQRHEILRTTYSLIDDRPMQIVSKRSSISLQTVGVRGFTEEEREEELHRLCREEVDRPFDLQAGPPMRATLFKLGPGEAVVLFVFHHIAVDGWSKGILFGELSAIYDALAAREPVPLPEVELQYADYAVWHRNWLEGGVLDKQLAYWREQLRGAPAALELPTDRPRPPVQSFRGDQAARVFERPFLDALLALSRSEGTTLFMTLLAALAAVLSRYSGQDDVVIGTPLLSRNRAELERVVGYFTNTVALRIDLTGDPTFRELLRRARETTLGAFANGDVPYELIVREANPQRDLSRSPIFQVMMGLRNESNPLWGQGRWAFAPSGFKTTNVFFSGTWVKFDLGIGMGEFAEGLYTGWEYSTDLFEAATVERLLSHFKRLVGGALENPDRRLSVLPLLSSGERRQVLVDWNAPDREIASGLHELGEAQACRPTTSLPPTSSLHDLVAAQAAKTPDAIAVEGEDGALTYAELDAGANQLARYLVQAGASRDEPIGVCLGRSTKLAVALLGILKSGAACLPLDPSYPPPRLEFMLRDSGAQLVVADAERAVQFAATGARVVLVDADGDAIARESGSSFDVGGEKDDLAYVLYTSGSTGEPRGVALTHRGLANHVIAATELYGIGPDDRVLQFASISFDMSLEETFVSWVAAATLVFRSETLPLLGREFWDWLRREGITILDLPTTYWHAWVDDLCDLGVAIPETIRVVVVGGDRALVDSYRRWLTIGGDRVRWFNTYGPTEASVIATAYEGPRTAEAVPDEIPIGRPLPNVRVYVLDRHLRPVPIGVPGELYVGGIGVARAYLNRPELTAERFILDVFTSASDAVMYRTGDIVRFLPSGDLVFVGRTDDQVKIRGFRVEPAEVEAALQDHPRVRQALVLAHEFAVERRLVAYTVADAGTDSPDPEELRRFLASRIPDFMIPAAFVGLDAFPLTASGKIDRDALPNPDLPQDVEFVAPRTATEETLAAIWREVLGLANVGVTYNFFALGGHSLLAMQVIARARQAFGVDVRLRSIFDAPTIAELARALETAPELQPQLEPKLIPVARQGLRLEESRPRRAVIGE